MTPNQLIENGWKKPSAGKAGVPISREQVYKVENEMQWKPHPMNNRLMMGLLLTIKEDGAGVTLIRGRIPKGETVAEHTHDFNDILYALSGKGKIWVEGVGDLALNKGVLIHVPPGISHRVYDVAEDLEMLDIFTGPTL